MLFNNGFFQGLLNVFRSNPFNLSNSEEANPIPPPPAATNALSTLQGTLIFTLQGTLIFMESTPEEFNVIDYLGNDVTTYQNDQVVAFIIE